MHPLLPLSVRSAALIPRTAGLRFAAYHPSIEPCREADILPMLEMTNEVEYLVSGTKYKPEALVKVKEHVQQRIAAGKMELAVMKDKGRIIASACLDQDMRDPDAARLSTVYVRPEYQGQGFGKRLTTSMMDKARQKGYTRMTLSVHNPVAVNLYSDLGFYTTGIDHHGDITMECPLKPAPKLPSPA